MKYFIIAGEASGDLHASLLIEALKKQDPKSEFAFLGGDLMAKAAGVQPIVHYRDMAYMGFVEVLRHLKQIKGNFKAARSGLEAYKPDRVILIDYPGFNLKMAKHAKKLGLKVVYYISPKVWAWKQWRVKTIKQVVDQMLCIFPFEVDFYAKHGYSVKYVGNPSVEEVDGRLGSTLPRKEFLDKNRLADRQIVALLPGSRLTEIRTNLPVMVEAMKQFPQYRGVIAGAPGIDKSVYEQFSTLPVVYGQTYDLLAHSRAALVTSGTATLETALAGVPQVVLYRDNGAKAIRRLKDWFLNVEFVSLPNLIAGREIIPELLFDLCTPDAVAAQLARILPDSEGRMLMLDDYAAMRKALGEHTAATTAAKYIVNG